MIIKTHPEPNPIPHPQPFPIMPIAHPLSM